MGLLLICPHCQAKLPLASRTCLACGADLRDLSREDRHYFIGQPAAPPPRPRSWPLEPIPEAVEVELVEAHRETMHARILPAGE